MTLRLDWCSHQAALYACTNWHYSGCVPAGKIVKIGVWESEKYIGCILFSLGAGPQAHRPFNLLNTEVCELTRVALTRHTAPVTKMVAIALKMLCKKCPGIKVVVSYADPEQDHHGGIYQAGNWIYLGVTKPTEHFEVVATNQRIHSKTLRTGRPGYATKLLKEGVIRSIRVYKHKYVYPFDEIQRKRLRLQAQPYPKRVGSADSGTGGVQPSRGGASPTSTLQSTGNAPEGE